MRVKTNIRLKIEVLVLLSTILVVDINHQTHYVQGATSVVLRQAGNVAGSAQVAYQKLIHERLRFHQESDTEKPEKKVRISVIVHTNPADSTNADTGKAGSPNHILFTEKSIQKNINDPYAYN
ncbi:hypothetical protein ACFL6U_02670, partial [Planctomycetota bacterium]